MGRKLALLVVLVVLTGCSDDSAGPRETGMAPLDSISLAVGYSLSYRLTFDASWTDRDGSNVIPPRHVEDEGTRELIGLEAISGRAYFLERFSAKPEGGTPWEEWRRFRQDGDALYRADVGTNVGPGEIPEGFIVDDLVHLHYPVSEGASWQRTPGSAAAVYVVEGSEVLDLAIGDTPAWRIRLNTSNAGPHDYTRFWYGKEGLLRRVVHVELNAYDSGTNEVVHIVTHEVDELVSVERGGRR